MVKVVYKYNVATIVNKPTQGIRKAMPYWYHIGNKSTLVSKYQNKWGKCQRTTHGIKTVNDMVCHIGKSRNQWCQETEECECPSCEDDRLMGCDSPLKCRRDAALKLDNLRPEWDPRKWPEDEPDTNGPRGREDPPEGYKVARRLGHSPPGDLTELLRIFTDPEVPIEDHVLREYRTPLGTTPQSQEVVSVYTDGSCSENGTRNARCGSGLWYETADPRNRAVRIGLGESSNNVGELAAILVAVQTHTDVKQIRIATDSQYAMDALTMHAEDWADDGFVDTKNGGNNKSPPGRNPDRKSTGHD
ncbi:ribonuclease H-like protein [Coprinellus micaceus]|uniref:ribonuclease H n=1 Tax=Coprinellus micaceus TaxID=71717 RepID=A0A4Y7SS02_COPMI|nr:ribonuclease H-like protein [Coprinellus micaceus]